MADGLIIIRYFLAVAMPILIQGLTIVWWRSSQNASDGAAQAGMAVAVAMGLVLLPKGPHPVLTSVVYVVAMTVTLWFWSLVFVGALYGATL